MEPTPGNSVFPPVAELNRTQPNAEDAADKTAREDFYVCPVCNERVDWRDPEAVMAHAEASTRFNATD